jgi:type I restriction enzyme S subunit
VTKVEALLVRVNAARERLENVPLLLKRFRQSVLVAACSGRLTEDWRSQDGGRCAPASLEALLDARRAVGARGVQQAPSTGKSITQEGSNAATRTLSLLTRRSRSRTLGCGQALTHSP